MLGFWDVAIIVALIAFFFGARRFKTAGRSLMTGARELKREATAETKDAGQELGGGPDGTR